MKSAGCLQMPAVVWRSGGEMAVPEEFRVLSSRRREGEPEGKADFTGILKLHAIQSVRKL